MGQELPLLRFLAQKVAMVHGPNHPAAVELGSLVVELTDGTEAWLARESREILPWLNAAGHRPIQAIADESKEGHGKRTGTLRRIRILTESYTPWEGSCGTVARLYDGLKKLDGVLAEYAAIEESSLISRLAG